MLQLDLSDTDRVCSPSVPSVYRQALHSKPGSQGSGKLILGDESGPSVQARWTRECITERNEAETEPEAVEVEVAQRLEMTIESVDGVALANKVSFVAVLESPDAGKAVVSYSLRLESEDFAQRPKTYITSSTFGRQGGEAVSDMDSTPQNSFWKCRGFRCVLDSLRDRIGRLKQDFYEWRKPQQHESDVDGEMESYTASYEDGGVGSGMEDQDSLPNSEGGETEGDDSWWHILERPSAHTQQEQQRVKPIKPSEVKPEVMAATPIHTPFSIPSIVSSRQKKLLLLLLL